MVPEPSPKHLALKSNRLEPQTTQTLFHRNEPIRPYTYLMFFRGARALWHIYRQPRCCIRPICLVNSCSCSCPWCHPQASNGWPTWILLPSWKLPFSNRPYQAKNEGLWPEAVAINSFNLVEPVQSSVVLTSCYPQFTQYFQQFQTEQSMTIGSCMFCSLQLEHLLSQFLTQLAKVRQLWKLHQSRRRHWRHGRHTGFRRRSRRQAEGTKEDSLRRAAETDSEVAGGKYTQNLQQPTKTFKSPKTSCFLLSCTQV